jgi:hypothetical protein
MAALRAAEAGNDDLSSVASNDDSDLGSEDDVEVELRRAERHQRISPLPKRRQHASPSPEWLRGRTGRRGGSLIVQTILKDSGGGAPWLVFRKMNYANWSSIMKVKL